MENTQKFDKVALLRIAFKGLAEHELKEIADLTEIKTYPPNHVLCQEDAYEDVFYIIADGEIIITKKISDEEGERVLREGGKGDLVGEMALIQNAPRAATVRTTSTCTVLQMGKPDFEKILAQIPRMAIDLITVTLDRLRANDQVAIQELQKTNKILRQLDRNKLEFIQVAAHELRTPLTVLKGYVNMMEYFPEIQENEGLSEVLTGINSGTDRMHEVVNLMLDITRFDGESLSGESAPVLIKNTLAALVDDFAPAAAERSLEIAAQYAADTPDTHGDPLMVQKALYHLIINAIKYTPDGGKIEIRTRPISMDDNQPGVEIAVQDHGIGLDAEHHTLVFEKFYQVGSVALHASGKTIFKGGGPGLGLAIVSGVARVHGGKVWVESIGHDEETFPGSIFYLQLPVDPPG